MTESGELLPSVAGAQAGDPAEPGLGGSPAVPVPVTRADGATWIFLAFLGFLIGQIVGVVFTVIVASFVGQGNRLSEISRLAAPPEWYIVSGLVGLWVGFVAACWLASTWRGTHHFFADLRLRFRPIDALGVIIGVAAQGLVTVMYAPFIHHIKNFNGPTTKLTGAAHGGGFALITVLTVVGAAFFEELFFRGLLFRGLLRAVSPNGDRRVLRVAAVALAVLVDGAIFGAAHAELVQFAGLAVFGAILALTAYLSGRLGMGMVAHGTFNLVAVLSILNSRGGVIH